VESSGGPPRKYFSLTEKGAAFYKDLDSTWRQMADGVERVIRKEETVDSYPLTVNSQPLTDSSQPPTDNSEPTTDNSQPISN
jgi:PadR family transcriptional regulator PadR